MTGGDMVAVLIIACIFGLIGVYEVRKNKRLKIFEAAQAALKKQIADLEAKLAALRK